MTMLHPSLHILFCSPYLCRQVVGKGKVGWQFVKAALIRDSPGKILLWAMLCKLNEQEMESKISKTCHKDTFSEM